MKKPDTAPLALKWKDGGYLSRAPRIRGEGPISISLPESTGTSTCIPSGPTGAGGEGKDADVQSWNM